MDERRDPMALWVGEWTPEDVIDRETRRSRQLISDGHPRDEREASERTNKQGLLSSRRFL